MISNTNQRIMTFGEHMEVLRRMLLRVITVIVVFTVILFFCKKIVWNLLLAPSECNFVTYRVIEKWAGCCGKSLHFQNFNVGLISTKLSGQFIAHITVSVYLSLICAFPYILLEMFHFVSPALTETERKHSLIVVISVYILFSVGVLMNYYLIFPISFQFLGTYNVDLRVRSTITLDSYVETFSMLTLLLGLVFQLPVVIAVMTRMKLVSYDVLTKYRRHALLILMVAAAIVTPPDVFTLILVTMPLYVLFELSIRVSKIIAE